MKELFDFSVIVLGMCTLLILALAVMTLPFAFIGFILLAAANVFSAGVTITYLGSFVVGFAASILIGLISN